MQGTDRDEVTCAAMRAKYISKALGFVEDRAKEGTKEISINLAELGKLWR